MALKRELESEEFPGSPRNNYEALASKLLHLALNESDMRAALLILERIAPKELALEQARQESSPNEAAAALMHAWAQRLNPEDRQAFEALRRKALFGSAPGYLDRPIAPDSSPTPHASPESEPDSPANPQT